MERQKELIGPYPSSTLKEPLNQQQTAFLPSLYHYVSILLKKKQKQTSPHKITLITVY